MQRSLHVVLSAPTPARVALQSVRIRRLPGHSRHRRRPSTRRYRVPSEMEPVRTAWAISEPDSPSSRSSQLSPKRLSGEASRISFQEIAEDTEWAALASAEGADDELGDPDCARVVAAVDMMALEVHAAHS